MVCLKIKGGREVRLYFSSYLQFLERVRRKKTGGREVRLESGFRICVSQNQGNREVHSFLGSYLQFLESARKNPGR